MSQTPSLEPPVKKSTALSSSFLKKLGPLIGLALVFALFSILRPHTFPQLANLQLILLQTSVVGTAALGMTVIIISGGIDLSVGSVVACGTIAIALLLNAGMPQLAAVIGGTAIGMGTGFITGNLIIGQVGRVVSVALFIVVLAICNDYAVSAWIMWICGAATLVIGLVINEVFLKDREFTKHLKLTPFIATLGMMTIVRGLAHWLGDNSTVDVRGKMWIKTLLDTVQPKDSWQIFPLGVWLLIALAVCVALMLRYTQFGRHVYAVGSNEQTARLCGVNVDRTKLLVYVLGVGCAGLASVLQFAYLKGGDSTTAPGMELNIIAAVVIGGASLSGGEGGVVGSLIGALLMNAVANGCTKMGWDTYVQEIVTGAIIIVASQADRLRHRRAG